MLYPYFLRELSEALHLPITELNKLAWSTFGVFRSRIETGSIRRGLECELREHYLRLYAKESGTTLPEGYATDKTVLAKRIITDRLRAGDERMFSTVSLLFQEPAHQYISKRLYGANKDEITSLYSATLAKFMEAVRMHERTIDKSLYEYFVGILKYTISDEITRRMQEKRRKRAEEDVNNIASTNISGHNDQGPTDNIIEKHRLLERLGTDDKSEVLSKLFGLFGRHERCEELLRDIYVRRFSKDALMKKHGWSDEAYRKHKSRCTKKMTEFTRNWLNSQSR